jgi:tetratricopeptide (TPR) repeat protein
METLTEIISNSWFAFAIGMLGLISSYYFYAKGKSDGDKTAKMYKLELEKANLQIRELRKVHYDSVLKSEISFKDILDIKVHSNLILETLRAEKEIGDNEQLIRDKILLLVDQEKIPEARILYEAKNHLITDKGLKNYIQGILFYNEGNYITAIAHLNLAATVSNKPVVLYLKTHILIEKLGRHQEALDELNILFERDGTDVTALLGQAKCYLALKQMDLAEKKSRAVLEINKNHAGALNILASIMYSSRKFEEAIFYAKLEIENNGDFGYANGIIGLSQIRLDQSDSGVEFLKAALKYDFTGKIDIVVELAGHYYEKGYYVEQESLTAEYRRQYPGDFRIHGLYMHSLNALGKHKRVLELAKDFSDIKPSDSTTSIILSIGWALFEIGDFDEAREKFEEVLSFDPNNFYALLFLAKYYADKQDSELHNAISIFHGLISRFGETIFLTHELGLLYIRNDQPHEAVFWFDRTLAKDPYHELASMNRNFAANMILIKPEFGSAR